MIHLPFGIAIGRWMEWTETQAELGILERARDELSRQLVETQAWLDACERLRAREQSEAYEGSVLNPCD